jgi:hypothetical protein
LECLSMHTAPSAKGSGARISSHYEASWIEN